MHLVTFTLAGQQHIGVLDPATESVVNLSTVAPDLPRSMLGLIEAGAAVLPLVRQALDSGEGRVLLSEVQLLAPIPVPRRDVLCVGKNYREHVQEVHRSGSAPGKGTADDPAAPIIFTKATFSVSGPGDTIPIDLDPSQTTDYEGELGVIIGTGGRGISKTRAMDHIYGYTIINDVTARKLQSDHMQWFLSKSIDGFCPMGPALLTRDAMPDLNSVRIKTSVNGELRQDAGVAEMIFDIPTLIETISRTMTLLPGDILATGTPAGVGMGFSPPKWLLGGDQVSITIDPIGTLNNPVA